MSTSKAMAPLRRRAMPGMSSPTSVRRQPTRSLSDPTPQRPHPWNPRHRGRPPLKRRSP